MNTLPQWLDRALSKEADLCPLMSGRDVYKMLYQAVLGAGHLLIGDMERVREYFFRERTDAPLIPSLPTTQVISPLFVRCHLAPLKEMGVEPLLIYEAFLRSAGRVYGNPDEVRLLWESIKQDAIWGAFLNEQADYASTDAVVQALPLVHLSHSDAYRLHYKPSYRVVMKQYIIL